MIKNTDVTLASSPVIMATMTVTTANTGGVRLTCFKIPLTIPLNMPASAIIMKNGMQKSIINATGVVIARPLVIELAIFGSDIPPTIAAIIGTTVKQNIVLTLFLKSSTITTSIIKKPIKAK